MWGIGGCSRIISRVMSHWPLPAPRRGLPLRSVIYLRCLPPGIGRATLHTAGILGIATLKSCGMPCRHDIRWALTPPFHPYPPTESAGGCFLSRYSTVADSFPKEMRRSMLPGLSSRRSHVGRRRNVRLHDVLRHRTQSY